LFIEVNKIPLEGLDIDRALSVPPVALGSGELAEVEGARLKGTLRRSRADVEFRGTVDATVRLTCSRCLSVFKMALQAPCYRIFRPGPLGRPESEHELVEEELALTPFDGSHIELQEMVVEQVYLGVPLKPLCRDTCRGLCPTCGAERNNSGCSCPEGKQNSDPLTSKLSL